MLGIARRAVLKIDMHTLVASQNDRAFTFPLHRNRSRATIVYRNRRIHFLGVVSRLVVDHIPTLHHLARCFWLVFHAASGS